MSRDSFFVPGAECSRVRVCLRGMGLFAGMSHADASIRKFELEIGIRCMDCPCFDLFAASIRKSGPEIENRCTVCPCFRLLAASIRKSGPEIENQCSAIVPASRMARLQRPLPQRCRVRCQFSLPQSRTVPPAESRSRKVEQSACVGPLRQRRTARLKQSRAVQAETGRHEGGIILSKSRRSGA